MEKQFLIDFLNFFCFDLTSILLCLTVLSLTVLSLTVLSLIVLSFTVLSLTVLSFTVLPLILRYSWFYFFSFSFLLHIFMEAFLYVHSSLLYILY